MIGENLLTFTKRENIDAGPTVQGELGPLSGNGLDEDAGIRIRTMDETDLERILELRSVVSWAADPRAFDILRGMREARWAVAEGRHGTLVGMVGAVPLGNIGILCHLAVHGGYRKMGLGAELTSWATAYLRSRGAAVIRLYSTPEAEKLYRSSGFTPVSTRTVYRLENVNMPLKLPKRGGGHYIETLTAEDLPELYGVDRWSYGADRSALILAILRLHPGGSLVARAAGGRIKGYLVRSDAARAFRIGPFMASSPEVAWLLLARALEDVGGAPAEVTVTGSGPAHSLLGEFGFVGREDRLKMELGESLVRFAGMEQYGTTPYLAT